MLTCFLFHVPGSLQGQQHFLFSKFSIAWNMEHHIQLTPQNYFYFSFYIESQMKKYLHKNIFGEIAMLFYKK
ncbi:hypothetical protein RUMCAL_01759 [Ruminococcus callidus ATCC 27760]|uniref:Uncharacterized protein n=1 Tax=Ruminococcus callidus ATCC 27760 TaxID=411473 RepID=U2K8Z8_9FIRM|nr:hypothetical protein RUMCAL_01759 [Ruminococcus callidus ATCC 27760]